MARKTETFTLGEDTYRITQLDAEVGKGFYRELMAIAAKVFETTALGNLEDEAAVAKLMMQLIARLPLELQDRLDKAFAKTTEIQAGPVWLNLAESKQFGEYFAGRYFDALMQWQVTCIKFNYLGFLGSKQPGSSSVAE